MSARPKFWASMFRRQPIEEGVSDPIEDGINAATKRLQAVGSEFDQALRQLVEANARRTKGPKNETQR